MCSGSSEPLIVYPALMSGPAAFALITPECQSYARKRIYFSSDVSPYTRRERAICKKTGDLIVLLGG
jgi:hypothetical protein